MSVIQTVVSTVRNWLKGNKVKREIIVNVEKLETRVAVLENGRLEEYMVEHPEDERLVGCVFKGRIQNLQDDLQAAFVDIGLKKNAFLHYWDMQPDVDAFLDEVDDGEADNAKGGKGGKEQGGSSAVQDHLFAFPSFFAGAWREPSGGQYFRRASRARGVPCSSASSR